MSFPFNGFAVSFWFLVGLLPGVLFLLVSFLLDRPAARVRFALSVFLLIYTVFVWYCFAGGASWLHTLVSAL